MRYSIRPRVQKSVSAGWSAAIGSRPAAGRVGFVTGEADQYAEGAIYPDGLPLPPHTYDYVQYDEAGNDFILLKDQTALGPDVKAVVIPTSPHLQ